MYIYNIAVRWNSGDLEGFGASALTKEAAYKRAVQKAHDKASCFTDSTGFDVLTEQEYKELSVDDQDELQNHWDNEVL